VGAPVLAAVWRPPLRASGLDGGAHGAPIQGREGR